MENIQLQHFNDVKIQNNPVKPALFIDKKLDFYFQIKDEDAWRNITQKGTSEKQR